MLAKKIPLGTLFVDEKDPGDALRAAASKGCLAAVRFLVEEGVNKTDKDKQGRTPLMLATQNNHLAVVQFLKEQQPTKREKDDMLLTMDMTTHTHTHTPIHEMRD